MQVPMINKPDPINHGLESRIQDCLGFHYMTLITGGEGGAGTQSVT